MKEQEQDRRSTVEIAKSLQRAVKQYAVSVDKSTKEVVSAAIEKYLNENRDK